MKPATPNPGRKPHSRSWLKNLPETPEAATAAGRNPNCTQEVIHAWLDAGDSLQSVAQRCLRDFASEGCAQTEHGLMSALSDFRTWYQQRQRIAERKQTIAETLARCDANAKAVAEQMASIGANAEQMAAADHLIFQAMATEAGKEDKTLWIELEKLRIMRESALTKGRHDAAKLKQKDQELELATRRVKLLETKEAKAKETLGDGTLTPEQREARMKQIFGVQ